MTIFHGGTEEEGEEEWDKDSLYFQIPEGGMVITDSIYKGDQAKIMTTTDEMSKEMKKYIGRAKRIPRGSESINIHSTPRQHGRN